MANMEVKRKLCVNDCVVPVQEDMLPFIDPYHLANMGFVE